MISSGINLDWFIGDRQEIRLKLYPLDSEPISKPLQNSLTEFFNDGGEEYSFNSFLELPQGRILAITNYAFDKVTMIL